MTKRIVAAALCICLALCTAVALAVSGTGGEGLITKSYVDGTYTQDVLAQADARIQEAQGALYQQALSELEECLPGGVEPEKAWDARRLAECLDAFLRGLPEEERALFLGRYWYLYSAAELARRFGLREGAVRTRLYRCRKRLRAYLEEEVITV